MALEENICVFCDSYSLAVFIDYTTGNVCANK